MKILVCISITPDTTAKIAFTNNNTEFNKQGVQFTINPYDEITLSRAIELRDALKGSVTVINVGEVDAEQNIRKALAIGADDAIRINAHPADAFFVSKQIAEHIKDANYDIILTGMETIDYNGAQVGGMLGEMLDIPTIFAVTKLDVDGKTASVERLIDGGTEALTVPLPFVAASIEGMAEPRIPTMRGIMSARTKPLKVVEPVAGEPATEVVNYELPPAKKGCKFIDADKAEELIELLHSEAKVI